MTRRKFPNYLLKPCNCGIQGSSEPSTGIPAKSSKGQILPISRISTKWNEIQKFSTCKWGWYGSLCQATSWPFSLWNLSRYCWYYNILNFIFAVEYIGYFKTTSKLSGDIWHLINWWVLGNIQHREKFEDLIPSSQNNPYCPSVFKT